MRATLPVGVSDATVSLEALVPDATIHYTIDGSAPTSSSRVYSGALHLAVNTNTMHVTAIALLADRPASAPSFLTLSLR